MRTFCTVLAYTGARISEVLALMPKHFDREAQLIVFESLKKRRKGVFRAVPVPAALLRLAHKLRLKGGGGAEGAAERPLWDAARVGIMGLNQPTQIAPGNHLIHLGKKFRSPRCLAVAVKSMARKSLLAHQNPPRNTAQLYKSSASHAKRKLIRGSLDSSYGNCDKPTR